MTVTEFNNKRQELGITTGINTVTTAERIWNHKITKDIMFTIPAGSKVHIDFSTKYPNNIFVTYNDTVKISRIANAYNWARGFRKPPSINTLEKQMNNGICTTPTGHKTEPDGYGPDSSPSWPLVFGLI